MSENQLPPPDRSVKVTHLVFGLLFLGLAGVWALVASSAIEADSLPLVAPAVLVAAGVVGLVASLAGGRNRQRRDLYREQYRDQYADYYTEQYAGRYTETHDEPLAEPHDDQQSDQPDTTTQERPS